MVPFQNLLPHVAQVRVYTEEPVLMYQMLIIAAHVRLISLVLPAKLPSTLVTTIFVLTAPNVGMREQIYSQESSTMAVTVCQAHGVTSVRGLKVSNR